MPTSPPDPAALIRAAFNRRIPQDREIQKGLIRLSGIGHGCKRKIYLDTFADLPIEEVVGDNIRARVGDTMHMFYGDLCKHFIDEYDDAEFEERFFHKKWQVTGKIDMYSPRWGGTVIDFKTTNGRNYARIQRSRKADFQYRMQLQAYMLFKKAKHGFIVYINQDSKVKLRDSDILYHPLFAIPYKRNIKMQREIVRRIKNIRKLQRIKVDPMRIGVSDKFKPTAPPCLWCGFKDICYEGFKVAALA